ncbi:hypothetical protein ALP52_101116 [Pseudomonas amygdali pv. mori]|uniref:Uncharacterized protein n=1 Tax=Pseudomonas amygdali pv. mori TaxID=34065 RepID=A0A3M5JGV5_PSEA0|nr:hypothetical protein ALP52_101116 [Pseudomonas amygdali pv. mori]
MKPSQPKYVRALSLLVTSLIIQTPAQARTPSSATADNIARLAVVKPGVLCADRRGPQQYRRAGQSCAIGQ